ncbi:uncharacterized protein A4U43_C01F13880 [Asparagus officinalis]|uniref:non-specific serine/threonine protein kinase n=1 Tax=Asparagus officinalis TaxID=4686 RepID=A0A5P1FSX1_ASPOF|nr:serine/threonine-protein kinase EDR1-like isoform X2 [Asparagus officinalis]ONK80099.1 uncharacterized protein A4U43_C01F13880 [Asparagus officinalis]
MLGSTPVTGEQNMSSEESASNVEQAEVSSQTASQILWSTGILSGPIRNGFYSVIPEKNLKENFHTIPSPDEIQSLGIWGLKADIILVDTEKDKKLSMLKQLSTTLVKGLNSNPASLIKRIAGLVTDFYKRPNSELSPAKSTMDEVSHLIENLGVQLLGQIRNGSCRPRAILFKVLADAVGLETKLVVGLPSDGVVEHIDSYRHMSVVVALNSVELLVDLMRFPGQLIPFSDRAMFMSHSSAVEDDPPEYDSCDSPLEPNSPLFGFTDKLGSKCCSPEKNDTFHSSYQRKIEAPSNIYGPPVRHVMLSSSSREKSLSSSHSVPDIANAFWRNCRRKAVIEKQQTASSSPEHPRSQGCGHSILSNNQHLSRDFAEEVAASRSEGASTFDRRRSRRRSISIIPEIGDDVVRAVRGMNRTLKQNRLVRAQADEGANLHSRNAKKDINDLSKNVLNIDLDGPDKTSGRISGTCKQLNPTQNALSLPSSPHEFQGQTSGGSQSSDFLITGDLTSTWSKVLHSSPFLNKPLLPFEEWNIDFSELTVGTRVGIGFFGEVFRGIWHGTDVAIKVFLEQDLTVENMEDFCNEVSILSRLRHPNVILFLGACMKPPHLSMVTEYMEMGSLYYLIHTTGQKKKLSWHKRLKMLRDICRGLMCMHRMKIAHRDLKSANCLVDKHWVVKICDFGLSRIMVETPMTDNSSAGTPEWMAPELMRNEPFTEKCDIFSLGVIMWELCTMNRPWEGIPPVQVVHAVANEGTRLEIPEGPLGKLISDCWAEPDGRPSCKEILTRLLDCEYTLC